MTGTDARTVGRDERAMSPVIEKSVAATITLLYVGSIMGLLYGGVVPGYESTTASELGERTLATAAEHVEQAPPQTGGDLEGTKTVDLPSTIQNTNYELVLSNGTLTLDHPTVELETTLSLGDGVTTTNSTWQSGGTLEIYVSGPADNRTIALGEDS